MEISVRERIAKLNNEPDKVIDPLIQPFDSNEMYNDGPNEMHSFITEPFEKDLSGYTKSYELLIGNRLDPLIQLNNTKGQLHDILRYELELIRA